MALELALHDPTYEGLAVKFYEQVIRIAHATNRGRRPRRPVGRRGRLLLRRAARPRPVVDADQGPLDRRPPAALRGDGVPPGGAGRGCRSSSSARAGSTRTGRELLTNLHQPGEPGAGGRLMLSMLNDDKLRRVLARMLDPNEFLGDHGIRSLSALPPRPPVHLSTSAGRTTTSTTCPAESDTGMFGGNSNWRGPIWAPINALIVRALLQMYSYYGDDFRVECPTGSGQYMTLYEVAQELSNRLASIFLLDTGGRRPVLRRRQEVHRRSALPRPRPLLRVLPRRQRRRPRRQPPDRLDRGHPGADADLRQAHRRR